LAGLLRIRLEILEESDRKLLLQRRTWRCVSFYRLTVVIDADLQGGRVAMRRAEIGVYLILMVACMYLQAATEEQKMITVTGKLVRVVGIGGESAGWAIQLESEIKIEGKPVKSIEVNHQTKRFEKLDNKRVEATGKLTSWHGIERGDWPVLEVTAIREAKSK